MVDIYATHCPIRYPDLFPLPYLNLTHHSLSCDLEKPGNAHLGEEVGRTLAHLYPFVHAHLGEEIDGAPGGGTLTGVPRPTG